jgi:exopolysaccharide biosynthesis polyprenyl glycosylphosphotransferase
MLACDAAAAAACLRAAVIVRMGFVTSTELLWWLAAGSSATCYATALYIGGLYEWTRYSRGELGARGIVSVACGVVGAMALFYGAPDLKVGRGVLLLDAILMCIWVIASRLFVQGIVGNEIGKIGAIVLSDQPVGESILDVLQAPGCRYSVRDVILVNGARGAARGEHGDGTGRGSEALKLERVLNEARLRGLRGIILANADRDTLAVAARARLAGMQISSLPEVYEETARRVPVKYVGAEWLALGDGFRALGSSTARRVKRVIDLVVSTGLITALLPVIGLTALAVFLGSGRPILYRQPRVGRDGQRFVLLKFRSMKTNAEENGAVWATVGDPRVTGIGRLLRRTKLDELPQLLNVLRGEMSFVGPRPERPEFVAMLDERLPYYSLRHVVSPGITGWAQVSRGYGASEKDALEKLEYDLYYIKNMSILLDVRIMLRTIGVVLSGAGAL